MVDAEGTGFKDFTTETAISGSATVSGNIVAISGAINVSGDVSITQNYIYRPKTILITGASGGNALGSGLTTSGYTVHLVTVKIPEIRTSGIPNRNFVLNSGDPVPYIYIGGYSGDAPYPGSGFMVSGKGFMMCPGDTQVFGVSQLDYIYAAAESSGNILSYVIEMR